MSAEVDGLISRRGGEVLGYLARRVRPVEDAADIYAEVLLTLWRRRSVVPADEREAFAWLLGVARNCLANHRRSGTRRHQLDAALRQRVATAVGPVDDGGPLAAALDRLPDDDRELLRLLYWEQLQPQEAAMVLGISAAAARKRAQRARDALRRELDRHRCTSVAARDEG